MSDSSTTRRGFERRREPRLSVHGEIAALIATSRVHPTRLQDFSSGGLAIASPQPFEPGEMHRLLVGSRLTPAVVVSARVAYCRHDPDAASDTPYLIGFTFVDLNFIQRATVEQLLDQLFTPIPQPAGDELAPSGARVGAASNEGGEPDSST